MTILWKVGDKVWIDGGYPGVVVSALYPYTGMLKVNSPTVGILWRGPEQLTRRFDSELQQAVFELLESRR